MTTGRARRCYFPLRVLVFLCALPTIAVAVAFEPGLFQSSSVRGDSQPTGIIEGVVVDSVTGRPLPGLFVQLSSVLAEPTHFPLRNDGGVIWTGTGFMFEPVMADAAGRFQFTRVPAGWFELALRGRGLGAYGQSTWSDPPRMLSLRPGERRTGIRLKSFARPIVSGRVVDEAGRPVIDVEVAAISAGGSGANRREYTNTTTTDDRGFYALSPLPGDFLIAALPPPVSHSNAILAPNVAGRQMVYPTTYHPSNTSLVDAPRIALRPGDRLDGIDIRVTPSASSDVTVRMPAITWNGFSRIAMYSSLEPDAVSQLTHGVSPTQVVFRNVATGSYELRVFVPPRMPMMSHGTAALRSLPPEPTLWARRQIVVADKSVDVSLDLAEGVRITGDVVFDGAAPPTLEQLANRPIVMEAFDDPDVDLRGLFLSTTKFTTVQLPPGGYFLRPVAPEGWYVKSITVAGREALDTLIDVASRDVTNVSITFTNRPARISGKVELDGNSESIRPWVTIFPADPAMWNITGTRPVRIARVLTGASGNYEAILPPGTYFAVATAGMTRIPQDLRALSAIAETVVVTEGLSTAQNLPAVKRLK